MRVRRYSSRLGFTRANPALEPETAWYVQLDASWKPLHWLGLDFSAFDAEIDRLIEDVRGVGRQARGAGAPGAVGLAAR